MQTIPDPYAGRTEGYSQRRAERADARRNRRPSPFPRLRRATSPRSGPRFFTGRIASRRRRFRRRTWSGTIRGMRRRRREEAVPRMQPVTDRMIQPPTLRIRQSGALRTGIFGAMTRIHRCQKWGDCLTAQSQKPKTFRSARLATSATCWKQKSEYPRRMISPGARSHAMCIDAPFGWLLLGGLLPSRASSSPQIPYARSRANSTIHAGSSTSQIACDRSHKKCNTFSSRGLHNVEEPLVFIPVAACHNVPSDTRTVPRSRPIHAFSLSENLFVS